MNLDYSKIGAVSFNFETKEGKTITELAMFDNVYIVRQTEKAIQFYMSRKILFGSELSGSCWIAKSQILDIQDGDRGSVGVAIVPEWLCKNIKLQN